MAVAFQERQTTEFEVERLTDAVARPRDALLTKQRPYGRWCYELDADCAIPAEYVLFLRCLGEKQPELEAKIGSSLRYHGYSKFFPLWALARYRNHTAAQ